MADNTNTTTTATPADINAGASGSTFDFAAAFAEEATAAGVDVASATSGDGVEDSDKTPSDKPAEDGQPKTETPVGDPPTQEPPKEADETAETRKARKILELATKKEAAAAKAVDAERTRILAELRSNPKKFLASLGSNLDEIIDAGIAEDGGEVEAAPAADAKPTDPTVAAVLAELKAVREELKAIKDEKVIAAQQGEFETKKAAIVNSIKADKRFPLINELGEHERVIRYQVRFFERSGRKEAVSWDRAAAAVESDLRRIRGTASPGAPKPAETRQPQTPPATRAMDDQTITGAPRTHVPPGEGEIPEGLAGEDLLRKLVERQLQ